jgi:hypothetical protein
MGPPSPLWCSSFRSTPFATRRSYSCIGPISSVLAVAASALSPSIPAPPPYALFSTASAAATDARLRCPATNVAGNTTCDAARKRRSRPGDPRVLRTTFVEYAHVGRNARWWGQLGVVRRARDTALREVLGGRRRRREGMAPLGIGSVGYKAAKSSVIA